MSGSGRFRLDESGERRAFQRLLGAAAGDDGAPDLPDAFAARVAARARSLPAAAPVLALGSAAWRALPALAALVLLVAAWTGYETLRLEADEASAVAQAVVADGGGAEAAVTLLLLDGDGGRP